MHFYMQIAGIIPHQNLPVAILLLILYLLIGWVRTTVSVEIAMKLFGFNMSIVHYKFEKLEFNYRLQHSRLALQT